MAYSVNKVLQMPWGWFDIGITTGTYSTAWTNRVGLTYS